MKVTILASLAVLAGLGSAIPLEERQFACTPGANPNNPNACWPLCTSLCGQGNCPNGYICPAASRCDQPACCGQCLPAEGPGVEERDNGMLESLASRQETPECQPDMAQIICNSAVGDVVSYCSTARSFLLLSAYMAEYF